MEIKLLMNILVLIEEHNGDQLRARWKEGAGNGAAGNEKRMKRSERTE